MTDTEETPLLLDNKGNTDGVKVGIATNKENTAVLLLFSEPITVLSMTKEQAGNYIKIIEKFMGDIDE